MQTQLFKNMPELTKLFDPAIFDNAITAARELVEINGRLMGRFLENQIGVANLCVDGSEMQMHTVGNITNPRDFTEKQTELYEEYRVKFTEVTNNGIKLAQDAGEEYVAWIKRHLPQPEMVKAKAAKAGKPAAGKAAAE
jgi:hypothetical protein